MQFQSPSFHNTSACNRTPALVDGLRAMALVSAVLFCMHRADGREPKRVALVIGNSQYESGPLKNPSNDADAISDAVRSLGFAVTKKKDVTRDQFEDAVDQLTSNLQTGDACLIFYAGHGIQMEQQNYLIPVGATLDRPQHVKRHCVSISYLLDALNASGCSLKVVVVDA